MPRMIQMDAAKEAQVIAHARALAALLYEDTPPEQLKTLAGIEEAIRGHMQAQVNPEVANFLSQQVAQQHPGAAAESPASSEN